MYPLSLLFFFFDRISPPLIIVSNFLFPSLFSLVPPNISLISHFFLISLFLSASLPLLSPSLIFLSAAEALSPSLSSLLRRHCLSFPLLRRVSFSSPRCCDAVFPTFIVAAAAKSPPPRRLVSFSIIAVDFSAVLRRWRLSSRFGSGVRRGLELVELTS